MKWMNRILYYDLDRFTCVRILMQIQDRRRDRGVVRVFSIFNAGGSVCMCRCVYTYAHTHTHCTYEVLGCEPRGRNQTPGGPEKSRCFFSLTNFFLGGAGKIMKLLPRQFPDKSGEAIPQSTCTLINNNLRFTLRTLRHLTEPDYSDPHYPRIDTRANLRRVLDTLQAWGGDETSKGLTLQVLYNLMREPDRTGDTARLNNSSYLDAEKDADPYWNRSGEDPEGYRTITRAQDLLYRLEIETHRIERVTRTLQNQSSHHHITQGMGIRILQNLTPRRF